LACGSTLWIIQTNIWQRTSFSKKTIDARKMIIISFIAFIPVYLMVSLKSIPGKKFSGRHLLAYMYTAFQKFEADTDTGIDFDEEYKQAKEFIEKES